AGAWRRARDAGRGLQSGRLAVDRRLAVEGERRSYTRLHGRVSPGAAVRGTGGRHAAGGGDPAAGAGHDASLLLGALSPARRSLTPELTEDPVIDMTLEIAERAVRAAQARARELGTPITVSVVDEAGRLVLCARGDGTHFLTPDTSRGKAVAAAA